MERTPAYRRIADLLESAIMDGGIPAGALVKISDVAKLFGASRSPVKQAFAILEEGGLVHPHDGQGFVVAGAQAPIRHVLTPENLGLAEEDIMPAVSAADELYFRMEREIILHSMSNALRINELALARHYDIGRTLARDLIFRAQKAGIVTRGSGGHWQIVPLDEQRCHNLYELRRVLEPIALRAAAPFIPVAKLKAMQRRLENALDAMPDVSIRELDRLESDLHATCLSFCPNGEFLEVLMRASPTYICGKYLEVILRDNPIIESFMHEHLVVIGALLRGQNDAAAQALERHISQSTDQIGERLSRFLALKTPPNVPFIR